MSENQKNHERQEAALSGKSASEKENLKLHGDSEAAQNVEARELRSDELTLQPRHVSDEELEAMEEAGSEPTVKATDDVDYDGKSVKGADVAAGAAPSRDSADYAYRDVVGTSIVGYQEQVPLSELED